MSDWTVNTTDDYAPSGPEVHWGSEADGGTDDAAVAARPVQTASHAQGGKKERNKQREEEMN